MGFVEGLGIPAAFTLKINCIKGSSIPIETMEKIMESRMLIKYLAMEVL
jgi:hypothetical protein